MDTLRMLVVDDEPGMRHSIKRALRDFRVVLPEFESETSFAISEAGTIAEGRERLANEAFDILLLDYKLPDGTGLEILDRLDELPARPLPIMVTAYATLETAIQTTKRGAHDFLPKPFTPVELKDVIRRATEHLITQRHARRLAEEKRQVRFQFIRVLGHELKAPLGAVEGFLNLLQQRVLGPELASYDEIVERCLVRMEGMRKLIRDLLDLTRIEAGERPRDLGRRDLVPIARNAIELNQEAAEKRGITLELDAPEILELNADRVEMEIILNNLTSNAVKYNRDGGRATVQLSGDDETVTIVVSDTGFGLSEEQAAKLFQDFVRIKTDHTRNITGSGLGLSTVKKVAQLYSGAVRVDSTPDQGSTFTVTLPRNHDPDAEKANDARRNSTLVTRAE